MVVEIILQKAMISEALLGVDTISEGPAHQASMFVDSALQATMFVDSALQATMFSAATSTLSFAGRGEGIQTGENGGRLMMTNFTLSSSSNCVLVRTELIPNRGFRQLSSSKERLREASGEFRRCFAELATIMFLISFMERVRVEKMFERGIAPCGRCISSSNLNINLKSHILWSVML